MYVYTSRLNLNEKSPLSECVLRIASMNVYIILYCVVWRKCGGGAVNYGGGALGDSINTWRASLASVFPFLTSHYALVEMSQLGFWKNIIEIKRKKNRVCLQIGINEMSEQNYPICPLRTCFRMILAINGTAREE